MINVGKYMAAAKGGPNVASAAVPSKAAAIQVEKTRLQPNMAGYEGGKSAWLQMEGSGYGRRAHDYPSYNSSTSSISMRSRTMGRSTDYSKPDYSRVTGDQDLSRLL